jgi:hypothetical protein
VVRRARAGVPVPRRGVGGGRCNDRHTRPAPTAAAGPEDEHPVQHLPPNGANPPLRIGLRPRRSHRRAQHRQSLGGEDGVEYGGELRVPIADQNRNRPTRSSRPMSRLRACWPTPSPTGCAVTPSTWTLRVAVSITNSTYRRCRNTVSTVKQVHRQHTLGLAAEELVPGQGRPLGCRVNPGALQHRPHGAGPNRVLEATQLTVDAAIAPGRVLAGQPQHQARISAATPGRPRRCG